MNCFCFQTNSMTAFPDYFETQSDLLQPRKPPSPAPSSTGYSGGAVAGIAVGMVVVGILLGYGIFYCRTRRLRSQYAYSMQSWFWIVLISPMSP